MERRRTAALLTSSKPPKLAGILPLIGEGNKPQHACTKPKSKSVDKWVFLWMNLNLDLRDGLTANPTASPLRAFRLYLARLHPGVRH
ncbi:Hypothetical protein AAM4_0256 [Actinomyces succiniciruminis]|uniref:Uncharacterized protein n=1 Tax=Actinomyces succiniciruminis TaxID=1522002 RepID=A0A1L7R8L8_9ACTO|nr:Hypothetical protein AAM4_0256 [Actinomyces succiniciruminis]